MINGTDLYSDNTHPINTITEIVMFILALCIYIIGVFLHTKIIIVSKRENEMTWKLDIANSFMLMIHYAHVIAMYGITYIIQDLYTYTGEWFCYVSKALTFYGNAYVTGHSLIISLMKYVIIVQYEKVMNVGQDKVKQIFLWIKVFYPIYIFAIFNIVRPDFLLIYDGISQANRCLGKSDMVSSLDSNRSAIKLHNICDVTEPLRQVSFEYVVFICRQGICWLHVIIVYSNAWNLIEIVIYCKIFGFMRR